MWWLSHSFSCCRISCPTIVPSLSIWGWRKHSWPNFRKAKQINYQGTYSASLAEWKIDIRHECNKRILTCMGLKGADLWVGHKVKSKRINKCNIQFEVKDCAGWKRIPALCGSHCFWKVYISIYCSLYMGQYLIQRCFHLQTGTTYHTASTKYCQYLMWLQPYCICGHLWWCVCDGKQLAWTTWFTRRTSRQSFQKNEYWFYW